MHTALNVLVWWLSEQKNHAEFMSSCEPAAQSWILIEIPGDQGNSLKFWTIIADLQELQYCIAKCPRVGNLMDLQYWDQINYPCDTELCHNQGQNSTAKVEVRRNLTLNSLCGVNFMIHLQSRTSKDSFTHEQWQIKQWKNINLRFDSVFSSYSFCVEAEAKLK